MSDQEIIIISDVSVIGRNKIDTWAAVIKTSTDELRLVKEFKNPTTSGEGELLALINAVCIADMLYDIENKNLTIYCDNSNVIVVPLRKDNGLPRLHAVKRHEIIENYLTPYLDKAASHKIIWIPGHKKGDTPTQIRQMHMWCDQASRKLAREINGI